MKEDLPTIKKEDPLSKNGKGVLNFMVFEEKKQAVNPVRYTEDRRTLSRRISFKRLLAEDINTVIAVFNKESEVVKLNNSILINIAMNCFIKQLEQLPEEEAIEYLERKALLEAKK